MPIPTLTTYPLDEIIREARTSCPFYRRLYAGLGENPALHDLPVAEPDNFWQAHHRDRQEVLTRQPAEGIVLNSGGTTGTPKFSYFSDEEWDSAVALSALACEGTGLEEGDTVANFFASGNLYSSLLFATQSFKAMRTKVLQFPLGHAPIFGDASAIIRRFQINTFAGFPTRLLHLLAQLDAEDAPPIQLRRILYAGELFSDDQRTFLQQRFPGVSLRSMSYASVDAGMIAYADETCAPGEHRVFDGATLVEIWPEDADGPTQEVGRTGRIIFTSLTRRLMPLLRYPSGDLGAWVDVPGSKDRRFALLGRAEEAARVASYDVTVANVRAALEPFAGPLSLKGFQLLVTQENLLDRLTVRLAGDAAPEARANGTDEILRAFEEKHPRLSLAVAEGIIHPVQVEWVNPGDLIISERTGKLRRVVDYRAR